MQYYCSNRIENIYDEAVETCQANGINLLASSPLIKTNGACELINTIEKWTRQ